VGEGGPGSTQGPWEARKERWSPSCKSRFWENNRVVWSASTLKNRVLKKFLKNKKETRQKGSRSKRRQDCGVSGEAKASSLRGPWVSVVHVRHRPKPRAQEAELTELRAQRVTLYHRGEPERNRPSGEIQKPSSA
jgi:hypothetical protein